VRAGLSGWCWLPFLFLKMPEEVVWPAVAAAGVRWVTVADTLILVCGRIATTCPRLGLAAFT
jgi:hypothetical protein